MVTFDVIVIGLGGMGSAALCHLAQRGLRVLGIEQFGIAHDRGSSHGHTRIIRKAYFEHADYVPLVTKAYELWHELEATTSRTLIHKTGLLLMGLPEGEVIPGVRRAADEHALDMETLSAGDVRARFPGFSPSDEMEALYERDAGYLAVEDCVCAHVDRAAASGAVMKLGEAVQGWTASKNSVEVTTTAGTYTAGHLVLCGGAWSGQLLRSLGAVLEVRRKVVLWFEAPEVYRADAGCPVFCFDTADGFFYGFPTTDKDGMKVGEHSGGSIVESPDELDRALHERDVEPVQRFVRNHLPGLSPTPHRHSVCMYTMTPDSHFIVDRHPDHANVVVAAGFSGHGFKFAPVVGSVVADIVTDGTPREPVDFLRMCRPGLGER